MKCIEGPVRRASLRRTVARNSLKSLISFGCRPTHTPNADDRPQRARPQRMEDGVRSRRMVRPGYPLHPSVAHMKRRDRPLTQGATHTTPATEASPQAKRPSQTNQRHGTDHRRAGRGGGELIFRFSARFLGTRAVPPLSLSYLCYFYPGARTVHRAEIQTRGEEA
jgi:hypothetical protein